MSNLFNNTTNLQEVLDALEGKASGVTLPKLTNEGTASDLLSGKQLINQSGEVVTGNIATKTSSNLIVSGATVSVPAGYYASAASKSVATATQATPSISVNSSGLITASATQTAGYVSAGTKSATKQLTTKGATTYTPSTTNQTIAAGTYLTGAQTIKGDANLIAGNIKSGVSIFGVSGTLSAGSDSGSTDMEDAFVTRNLNIYFNDRVTSIGSYAFYNCYSLTSVNFPNVTSMGDFAFRDCYNLTSINFPNVTSIGSYAFYGCYKLPSVSFPNVTSIGNGAFVICFSLTSVNFPNVTFIGSDAFYKCSCLSSLTLGASQVCTLSNSTAFNSTPYAGYSAKFSGTPYIYVPSSLVASYKAATNWTYFSSYITGITTANLITFTIDGVEHRAEEGMTWAEWCDSEYNTDGYYIDNEGYVYNGMYLWKGPNAAGAEWSTDIVACDDYHRESEKSWF